jgi:hypothetical protein
MVSGTTTSRLRSEPSAWRVRWVVKPTDFAYHARRVETALMMKALEP